MSYKTPDGDLIIGDLPEQILTNVKNASVYKADQELDEYLKDISQRVKEYHGSNYVFLDYAQILEYLIGTGYLSKL